MPGKKVNPIVRHAVGIFCEMFTLPDPYDAPWFPPQLIEERKDGKGRDVFVIKACTYYDVASLCDGTRPAGHTSRTITNKGNGIWEIAIVDWDELHR